MESEKFDLVFSGQILPRQELAVVKANMAALFKISSAQVEALFSGKAIVLKRNVDLTAANRYRVAIKKAGARIDLLKAGTAQVKAPVKTAEKVAVKAPVSTETNTNINSDASTQNAPRMSANAVPPQTPAIKKAQKPSASLEALPVGEGLLAPSADLRATVVVPDFEVLESGSDLLSEDERVEVAPLDIDLSAITVRALGPLVDDAELVRKAPVAVAELQADILPAGSSLLQDSERRQVTPANIQALDLDIAPVGARLDSEKPPAPPAPNVDHIALADD